MNQMDWILISSLQVFAEGGDGGGGSDTGVMAGAAAPQENQGVKASSGTSGRGASDAGMRQESRPRNVDRDGEFEKLIKGEYKDSYNRRVQEIIQKRLKDVKEDANRDPQSPLAPESAARKDGAPEGRLPSLTAPRLEEAVMRERLESLRLGIARQRDAHASRQYDQWIQQAEEARKRYPSLDLRAESRNPQFLQLLRSGLDVGSAYLVGHQDEIFPAIMCCTAKVVEQKLAGKLRTAGIRPPENGIRPQGAALTKTDVTKLSKADREAIRKRVAKGEKIHF